MYSECCNHVSLPDTALDDCAALEKVISALGILNSTAHARIPVGLLLKSTVPKTIHDPFDNVISNTAVILCVEIVNPSGDLCTNVPAPTSFFSFSISALIGAFKVPFTPPPPSGGLPYGGIPPPRKILAIIYPPTFVQASRALARASIPAPGQASVFPL